MCKQIWQNKKVQRCQDIAVLVKVGRGRFGSVLEYGKSYGAEVLLYSNIGVMVLDQTFSACSDFFSSHCCGLQVKFEYVSILYIISMHMFIYLMYIFCTHKLSIACK